VQYTDGQNGQPTITAEYGGDDSNLGSQGATVVTITGGKQEQSCNGFYLTEGLAPAAPTTGDDNIYITVHWGGEIPSSGLSIEFGAFSQSQDITADFAFNPITMYGPSSSVLMNINTLHATDGNYVIAVAAETTDPQTGVQCDTGINADVTVSGTTVFVQTTGQGQAEDIWLKGIPSPFQVSGEITASQYSNFATGVDQNGYLTSLTFTLTGPTGTDGTGTITIPKSLVSPGSVPTLMIDGQQEQIIVAQDSTNFYITYVTHFSIHDVELAFSPSSPSHPWAAIAMGSVIVVALPVIAVVAVVRHRGGKKRAGEASSSQAHPSVPVSPASIQSGAKFCGTCGGRREPGISFCTNCGADLRPRR
jgi:hypothetical protein